MKDYLFEDMLNQLYFLRERALTVIFFEALRELAYVERLTFKPIPHKDEFPQGGIRCLRGALVAKNHTQIKKYLAELVGIKTALLSHEMDLIGFTNDLIEVLIVVAKDLSLQERRDLFVYYLKLFPDARYEMLNDIISFYKESGEVLLEVK